MDSTSGPSVKAFGDLTAKGDRKEKRKHSGATKRSPNRKTRRMAGDVQQPASRNDGKSDTEPEDRFLSAFDSSADSIASSGSGVEVLASAGGVPKRHLQYGVHMDRGPKYNTMEDFYRIVFFDEPTKKQPIPPLNSEVASDLNRSSSELESAVAASVERMCTLLVCDGHGGTQVAEFCTSRLPHRLNELLRESSDDPPASLRRAFLDTEAEFFQSITSEKDHGVGSTATCALILKEKLHVANIGDTEAVICHKGKTIKVTTVHSPDNAEERKRVEACGGVLTHNRLGHPVWNPRIMNIAVTRAFGDAYFKLEEYTGGKSSGLIAEPSIHSFDLTPDIEFLLIASDGLWNNVSHEEATKLVLSQKDNSELNTICRHLTELARRKGSADNIVVLLVLFQPCKI